MLTLKFKKRPLLLCEFSFDFVASDCITCLILYQRLFRLFLSVCRLSQFWLRSLTLHTGSLVVDLGLQHWLESALVALLLVVVKGQLLSFLLVHKTVRVQFDEAIVRRSVPISILFTSAIAVVSFGCLSN